MLLTALCQVNKNFLEFFFLFHSVTAQIICSVDMVLTHAARGPGLLMTVYGETAVLYIGLRLVLETVCDEWHFFLYCSVSLSLQ